MFQSFLGMIATVGSLMMGLKGMMQGSPNQTFWMWSRVGAQGGTVLAMLGGAILAMNAAKSRGEKTQDAVSTHNP